jgi:3-hydroxybutyryl-CoA dehydrogenase
MSFEIPAPGKCAANEEVLREAAAIARFLDEPGDESFTGLYISGQLDSMYPSNVILARNSSSYPSSQFIDKLVHPKRVLSTHFYMPPDIRVVELMSCGKTEPAIIDFLMDDFKPYGLVPFRVLKESVGFIFNRIWAAIKRESLSVVAEGVSTPEDVDKLYQLFTGSDAGPFRKMDQVGL